MQQHQGLTFAAFDIMKANSIDLEEATFGRILTLRLCCEVAVHKGRNHKRSNDDAGARCVWPSL